MKTTNTNEFVLIRLEKPVKEKYHLSPNCAPRQRGEGCYGDCMDCFRIDEKKYERILKFQTEWDKRLAETDAGEI